MEPARATVRISALAESTQSPIATVMDDDRP
jgi:hypothetical protein